MSAVEHKDSIGQPIVLGAPYIDNTGEEVTPVSFTTIGGEEMVVYDWFGYQIEAASIVGLWIPLADYEDEDDFTDADEYDWVLAFEERYEQSPRDQFTLLFEQGYWSFHHDYRAIGGTRDDEFVPVASIEHIQTDELHKTLWKYIVKGEKP